MSYATAYGYATTYGSGLYVASEAHFFAVGREYKETATKRLVVCVPGFTSNALSMWLLDPHLPKAAIVAGFPTTSADYSASDEWGNDTAQTRITQIFDYAKVQLNTKTDKIILMAGSMGGCGALNWARANPTLVAALVLFVPAVNIQRMYDEDIGGFQSDIAAAYAGARPGDAYNPLTNAASYSGVPIKIWYASNDPYILPADITSFASSAGATTVNMGAVGHSAATADPDSISTFIDDYNG